MPEQPVDLVFGGDPSGAVNAAKKVQDETNKIGDKAKVANESFLQISSELSQVRGKIGKITLGITGFAAAAYAAIKPFRDHVSEAEKLSRALEINYEKAQELIIAERQSGLAIGAIRSAIEGLARAQAQGMISRDMQNLGFSLSEIASLRPDQLFDALSKKLRDGGLSVRQLQAAVNILGSQGADVALKLSANFEHFRDIAKDTGKIISEEAFEKLIKETNTLTASLEVMSRKLLSTITPWQSWSEAATASIETVNKSLSELGRFSTIMSSFRLGGTGMGVQETIDAMTGEQAKLQQDIKTQAEQEEISKASTANLATERGEGAMAMLDYLTDRMNSGGQNISTLQKVGLAATGGESEAIRLQRRQLNKADSIDKQLVKQTNVLTDRL